MPKVQIRTHPDLAPFGPEAVAAGETWTRAVRVHDEANAAVADLLVGGQRFNPLVIGSQDKPSTAEKAAIAADEHLADDALMAGRDLAEIGTPNHDRYRRDLQLAETRQRAAKRAATEAEARLHEAMRSARDEARAEFARQLTEANDTYRKAIAGLAAARRRRSEAEAAIAFCDLLDDPHPAMPLHMAAGDGPEIRVPNRMVGLRFPELIATLEADTRPAPAAVQHHSNVDSERTFTSELPRRSRQRLERDGMVRRQTKPLSSR